jgi:hypothetical protein
MADGMVERVARAIWVNPAKCDLRSVSRGPCSLGDECPCWPAMQKVARAAIAAMRDLPGEPGPRYTAGDYSQRNVEALIDDALETPPA